MTQMPSPFGNPLDMLGQVPPPARWMPFGNINVGGGIPQGLLQVALPALARSMGGPQNFPAQFRPMQNVEDQRQAQRYWQGQQQAMTWAVNADVASMHRTMMGAHRMMFDRQATLQEQQQYRGWAERVGGFLPAIEMFAGPEAIDVMMGPGGSATILASGLHRGLRNVRDPVTGAMGVRGRTAGLMAQEIFGQFFGPGADLAEMHGVTAGQAGALFEQLQRRGMAGVDLGARTPTERLRALAGGDFQQRGTQRRIAEAYLRGEGRDVTTTTIEAAREKVFGGGGTLAEIQAGVTGGNIDVQQMMEMPGAEELLSTAQGQTIGRRLKNMSGAVSAMQDIFGSLGRKGTMEELIQGLQALTQGGLASMSPAQLEQVVRTTKNLAEVSGLGIQGFLGLQAQGGNLADQLGLDRTLAIGATAQTASWLVAAKQTQLLDMHPWGGLAIEKQALLNQKLEMGTMASQTTNMFAATMRLQEAGVIQADTDAGRLVRAIEARQTRWTNAAGERLSTAMNDADFLEIMQAGGVGRVTAEDVLADRFGNQRIIRDQNLGPYGRGFQGEVDIEPFLANVFGNRMARQLNEQGVGGVLNKEQRRAAAAQVARRARRLGPEIWNDPVLFEQAAGELAMEALIAKAPNPRAAQTLRNAIDAQGITEMGMSLVTGLGRAIRNDARMVGYEGPAGLMQMHDPLTLTRQRAERAESDVRARMAAAMSSIGRHDPGRRLIGALQDVSEGGRTWDEALRDIMGFVPVQGPGAGMGIAIDRYRQAERYTQETVLQEEMDRVIAERGGETLVEYRARQVGDMGATAERNRQRRELFIDPDFMKRFVSRRREHLGRVGTLTERGKQEQKRWATVMEALNEGGQKAEAARLMIAREIGGEDIETGDMPAEWWEAKAAAAGTPAGRLRVEQLRQASDDLWRAQRGEPIDQANELLRRVRGETTDAQPADIGRDGLIFGDPVSKQLPPVNRQAGGGAGGGDGQDRRITARMSGTLTITGDQAVIAGDMELGDFEHNDVQTDALEWAGRVS